MQEFVLGNMFSEIELVADYKEKINAIWHLLPQNRHDNSHMEATLMLCHIKKTILQII